MKSEINPESRIEYFDQSPFQVESSSIASSKHPEVNEDSVLISDGLYGVLDGLGGHSNGSEASSIAKETIQDVFKNEETPKTIDQAKELVELVLVEAHNEVLAKTIETHSDMSTTGAIVYILQAPNKSKTAIIGSVGDSRVYHFHSGRLDQVTLDDSSARNIYESEIIARRVQSALSNAKSYNDLDPSISYLFSKRNIVTQALGQREKHGTIHPRINTLNLESSDILLICTDGVSDNCTDKEIEQIISQSLDRGEVVNNLLEHAQKVSRENNFRSKMDDMTAISIEVKQ
ncbi:hypothetical protein COS66_03495 [Candidatus Berkelbacteria bacterium CG06_land_8_20_14_3_00_43_10]|nr:MAG: hypothetical protein AUK41_01645 [Candidatus Berkelbacteria bacterium CG2_30_43_20]PIU86971.1 MAG: hypothetical protein COS66_03495 [Candidatus Berkelbacteria bacterium CG06_land_8_20_14_3_00_43_10]